MGANEYQIEESKKAVTQMDKILGDPQRLAVVAKDFVEHYEKRIEEGSTVCGKAMFVCSNRFIAYDLYKQIIALRPEWAEKIGDSEQTPVERIKLVMTRDKDDAPELRELIGSDEDRKALDVLFKNPESNFKIAIVVSMWITGFDVPCLDTMYIDKPLQKHTLVQTISRVNRVYEGKDKGLVVDYIGIKTNMNNALKQYAGAGDIGDNVETIEQSLTMVKDELDILRRMFAQFDYSKFTTGTPLEQLECLKHAAEFVQATEKTQNQFMGHTKKLKSAFNLCSNHEAITDEDREHIHFFTGVRSIIYKLTKGDAPDASQMNRKVSQMIAEALQSEGVEEVVQVNANTKDLDLLSQDYMARLEKLKLPNTKVKLMEKLLRTVITNFKKVNKMKGVDFTKRLNALVQKYNDRSDNAVFAEEVLNEVAKQMAELLQEVNKEKKSFKDLGITYEEKAFYDILKEIAHKFGFDYPEEKLIPLSAAVKKMVDDKSRYTDWTNRSDIKAELQMDLILILAEHGYPPVPQDDVFKEIFEQAENFKRYESAEEDILPLSELSPVIEETKVSEETAEDTNVIPLFPEYHEGSIPLYTLRAACGYFEDGEVPEEEGWVDATGNGFTPDPKRHFAVHAKGNSMQPKIQDGDICVFEWYRGGSRNGEIVLTECNEKDIDYGGMYTIKKYHSEKNVTEEGWQHTKVELMPLNNDYDVIELGEDSECRTIGILKCVL
jgi:type I restriction enzyme R subunit